MNDEIFMVIVDSTSDGDYENNAHALLFKTFEEAKKYVEDDILDSASYFAGEEDEVAKSAKWYGDNEAQLRKGSYIVDWKIEKVKNPS